MPISVTLADLEEGESWDDEITVVYRRDEAHMMKVVLSSYVSQAEETIKAAMHAAADSNPDAVERLAAAFAASRLIESTRLAARAGAALGAVIAPQPLREEMAVTLAEARADDDRNKETGDAS